MRPKKKHMVVPYLCFWATVVVVAGAFPLAGAAGASLSKEEHSSPTTTTSPWSSKAEECASVCAGLQDCDDAVSPFLCDLIKRKNGCECPGCLCAREDYANVNYGSRRRLAEEGVVNRTVELALTTEVQGAAYPVQGTGSMTECSKAEYETTPCACYGGAARRAYYTKKSQVAIDTGSYFAGSGLFYSSLGAEPSATLSVESDYATRGLDWCDLRYGSRAIMKAKCDGVMYIASNLDVSGDPDLEAVVRRFAVFERNGVSAMVISFIGRDVADTTVSTEYRDRVESLERGLITTFASIYELGAGDSSEAVDLTIMLLPATLPDDEVEKLLLINDDDGLDLSTLTEEERQYRAAIEMGNRGINVDLVIRVGAGEEEMTYRQLEEDEWLRSKVVSKNTNWVGHDFFVVDLASGNRGVIAQTLKLDMSGTDVVAAAIEDVVLDCTQPEDPDVRQTLEGFKDQVDEHIDTAEVGYTDTLPIDGCEGEGKCWAARFVATAVREYAGLTGAGQTSLAFVDGNDIREDLLGPELTKRKILNSVPDLDEIVVGVLRSSTVIRDAMRVANEIVKRAMQNGIYLYADPISYEWAVVEGVGVTLGKADFLIEGLTVDEAFLDLELSTEFAVATTRRIAEIVLTEEDDFDLLQPGTGLRWIGGSLYDAVVAHVEKNYEDESFDPEKTYGETLAVSRGPDVEVAHVAFLCGTGARRVEECDHARLAVAALNDHYDTLYDQLVEEVRFQGHEASIGEPPTTDASSYRTCGVGLALEAVIDIINNRMPEGDTLMAVVTSCSVDVAEVASISGRAKVKEATGRPANYVVVSPSSTASSLKNEVEFPKVARLATSEEKIGQAIAKLTKTFGWQRVAALYEDSIWGQSSIQGFVDAYPEADVVGGGQCLGSDECEHYAKMPSTNQNLGMVIPQDLTNSDGSQVDASYVLDTFLETGSRILYLSAYEETQRAIFHEAFDRELNQGYAFLSSLPTVNSLFDVNSEVDSLAIYGQLGSMGFQENDPAYQGDHEPTTAYLDARKPYGSVDACFDRSNAAQADDDVLDPQKVGDFDICDMDGDFSTTATFGLLWFDAVLAVAEAVDDIAKSGVAPTAEEQFPDLYETLINKVVYDGVSGVIRFDTHTGDRLNKLELVNLRLDEDVERLAGEHTHDDDTAHSHDDDAGDHSHGDDDDTVHTHGDDDTDDFSYDDDGTDPVHGDHDDDTGDHSHDDDQTDHAHDDDETDHEHGDDTGHTHDDDEPHSHDDGDTGHTHDDDEPHSHDDDEPHSHDDDDDDDDVDIPYTPGMGVYDDFDPPLLLDDDGGGSWEFGNDDDEEYYSGQRGGGRRLAVSPPRGRRRLAHSGDGIPLDAPSAAFDIIGTYDASSDTISFIEGEFAVFPGPTREVPVDRDPVMGGDSKKKNNRGHLRLIIIIVVVVAAALLLVGAFVFEYVVRRQKQKFREEAVHFAAEYDVIRPFLHERRRIVVEKSRAPEGPPPRLPLSNRLIPESSMPAAPVVVENGGGGKKHSDDFTVMEIDAQEDEHFQNDDEDTINDAASTVVIAPVMQDDQQNGGVSFWDTFDDTTSSSSELKETDDRGRGARVAYRDMWCWKEDDTQIGKHRDSELIDGAWIQYSDVDQERLCDLHREVEDEMASSTRLRILGWNGHVEYDVDVSKMTQRRVGNFDVEGTREVARFPGRRRVYLTWYWLEDREPQKWRLASGDGKVYQPDKEVPWTRYTDDGVQNDLSALYKGLCGDVPRGGGDNTTRTPTGGSTEEKEDLLFAGMSAAAASSLRGGHRGGGGYAHSDSQSSALEGGDAVLRLNEWNQTTTNYAEVQYEVNVRSMEQTRLDTRKIRRICVRLEHPDSPARDNHEVTDASIGSRYRPPEGLPRGDALLPLHPGRRISLIKRPVTLKAIGEWGYGAELDPATADIVAEGWFPMSCVDKIKTQVTMPEGVANRLVARTQPPPEWTGDVANNELFLRGPADAAKKQPPPSPANATRTVRLVPGTREWRDVAALFEKNNSPLSKSNFAVASIVRIQNLQRWVVYRAFADDKSEVYPVFHGTRKENADKIVATGLNRDYSRSDHSQHGRGVNFFLDANNACHRDYSNLNDDKYVFVCSLAVGRQHVGLENGVIPPGYDTFVDTISKPSIYVATHDSQHYTKYLVRLSRNGIAFRAPNSGGSNKTPTTDSS